MQICRQALYLTLSEWVYFVKTGLLPSKGEARRLVQQNGLSINDVKYNDVNGVVTEDMITDEGMIIKKGKKTFHRVVTK